MNLYRVHQIENNNQYETYEAVVVCAKDKKDAMTIMPEVDYYYEINGIQDMYNSSNHSIVIKYLGRASEDIPRGIILSNF